MGNLDSLLKKRYGTGSTILQPVIAELATNSKIQANPSTQEQVEKSLEFPVGLEEKPAEEVQPKAQAPRANTASILKSKLGLGTLYTTNTKREINEPEYTEPELEIVNDQQDQDQELDQEELELDPESQDEETDSEETGIEETGLLEIDNPDAYDFPDGFKYEEPKVTVKEDLFGICYDEEDYSKNQSEDSDSDAIIITDQELSNKPQPGYKSKPKKPILTAAEKNFYDHFKCCIPEGLLIGLKVRLFDIVNVDPKRDKKIYHSVIMMHADFVLFDRNTLQTLLVIELDDRSHLGHKSVDKIKDYILKANGVPILRIKCARKYNKNQLYNLIKKATFK